MDQFYAAYEGDLERVQEFVTRENVDEVKERGKDVAAWVVGLGAAVNTRDDSGATPLHLAAARSYSRCVQLLLEAGADAGIANNYGSIPLHLASKSVQCAVLLIAAHPAGVHAVDTGGHTPLHAAAAAADGTLTLEVCALLLGAGSRVDSCDGRSPLYWALCHGKRDVAELFLDRGAQLDCVKVDKVDFYDWNDNLLLTFIPEWALSFVARRNACRSSCWAVLELTRRRSKVIGGNNRDVLGIIARMAWDSRRDELWVQKENPL